MTLIEVCSNSLQSAINAEKGGAHRIELCENLEAGGITPSPATILMAKEKLRIPVFVLIRPRGGNFVYDDLDFERMKRNIAFCKSAGVDGVVIGVLNEDGTIDIERNSELVQAAKPMQCTFHRAFDRCENPKLALEQIIEMGFDRILTSGQADSAENGAVLLRELVSLADSRIQIMPGAGVNSKNISAILKATNANEIHFSAKQKKGDNDGYFETNELEVRRCAEQVR